MVKRPVSGAILFVYKNLIKHFWRIYATLRLRDWNVGKFYRHEY